MTPVEKGQAAVHMTRILPVWERLRWCEEDRSWEHTHHIGMKCPTGDGWKRLPVEDTA